MDHSYSAQLEQKVQCQAADLALQADEIEWSAHYRALLESKLEEAGLSPPKLQIGLVEAGLKTTRKQQTKTSKDKGYEPSFFTSAIAQSQNEARNVKDMLAKVRERGMNAFSCHLFFSRSPFFRWRNVHWRRRNELRRLSWQSARHGQRWMRVKNSWLQCVSG